MRASVTKRLVRNVVTSYAILVRWMAAAWALAAWVIGRRR
jgi:hypothetical protein